MPLTNHHLHLLPTQVMIETYSNIHSNISDFPQNVKFVCMVLSQHNKEKTLHVYVYSYIRLINQVDRVYNRAI